MCLIGWAVTSEFSSLSMYNHKKLSIMIYVVFKAKFKIKVMIVEAFFSKEKKILM